MIYIYAKKSQLCLEKKKNNKNLNFLKQYSLHFILLIYFFVLINYILYMYLRLYNLNIIAFIRFFYLLSGNTFSYLT